MKTFWNDYKDLCEQTGAFYKNHWKGIIVMNVAVVAVEYAVYKAMEYKHKKEYEDELKKHMGVD